MNGLLTATFIVVSASAGFAVGTHYYANADLPTKLEVQRVTQKVISPGPTIRERCNGEWGTNYAMVKYCIDRQTKAARSLGLDY